MITVHTRQYLVKVSPKSTLSVLLFLSVYVSILTNLTFTRYTYAAMLRKSEPVYSIFVLSILLTLSQKYTHIKCTYDAMLRKSEPSFIAVRVFFCYVVIVVRLDLATLYIIVVR